MSHPEIIRSAALGSSDTNTGSPAPSAAASNASVYRFEVGDFECAVISDGSTFFPSRPHFGTDAANDKEVHAILADHSLPLEQVRFYFNVLFVNTGRDLILIDSGAGKNFGDACGKIAAGLSMLGHTPEQINVVHLSHAHFDHFGGLLTSEGKPAFPNALHLVAKEERDFWMSKDPDQGQAFYDQAQGKIFVSQAREVFEALPFTTYRDGDALPGGVLPEAAPGHTPGHCIYRVRSRGEELLHLSDLVTNFAVSFDKPDWPFIFDCEPARAVASRKKILAQGSGSKIRAFGNHLPFPGLGRIRPEGPALLRWEAEPWVF
ncbi:MBL fold metallo-hydrolase [Luteolibacter luteus]|uniref:MBL fold metallo-hydrolase n=1 Tax=Luteolibacter luteus TaxID=2728835 RepID=A0A858RF71_9BACT|nr:MBL fold metallo-hydrolase [Luteolibacter luteus]QJE95079.1 MBL fold metallo-hydrolase [Luteolibacter luteus]